MECEWDRDDDDDDDIDESSFLNSTTGDIIRALPSGMRLRPP